MNFLSGKPGKILSAVFVIVIALFMVVLCFLGILKKDDVTYKNAEGTIVRIDEDYDITTEQFEYTVFVDYEVDGVKYKGVEYGAYDSSMKIGDTVTLKYDVDNPEFIQAEGSEIVPYIVGGASLVVLAVGIYMLIKAIRQE